MPAPKLCIYTPPPQVGGIKEKLLAARAAGLSRALVPARNMREVELYVQEATQDDNLLAAAQHTHDNDSSNSSTAATAGSSSSRDDSSSSSSPGLQVIPVSRLEDVLAAAFDPPYLLRRHSRL